MVLLEREVQRANTLADERAKDDGLEKIIEQGRQEVATGQEKVESMLGEILGKQNEALKAAEEARNTVQALEDLAIKAAQAQELVDRAIQEQLTTIKLASQQNLINLAQVQKHQLSEIACTINSSGQYCLGFKGSSQVHLFLAFQ